MKNNILSQNAFWIVNKDLAKTFGLDSAILLADLVTKSDYFKKNDNLNDGWFYNTSKSIENDTTLNYRKQKRVIKLLESKGFIKTVIKGVPAKLYFKINEKNILKFLIQHD